MTVLFIVEFLDLFFLGLSVVDTCLLPALVESNDIVVSATFLAVGLLLRLYFTLSDRLRGALGFLDVLLRDRER